MRLRSVTSRSRSGVKRALIGRPSLSAVTKRGSMSTGTSFSRSRTRCVSGRTTARRSRSAFAFA